MKIPLLEFGGRAGRKAAFLTEVMLVGGVCFHRAPGETGREGGRTAWDPMYICVLNSDHSKFVMEVLVCVFECLCMD